MQIQLSFAMKQDVEEELLAHDWHYQRRVLASCMAPGCKDLQHIRSRSKQMGTSMPNRRNL